MDSDEELSANPLKPYTRLELIGKGAYGEVYKGIDQRVDEFVALKKLNVDAYKGVDQTIIREVSTLKELEHPNIVALKDVISCPSDWSEVIYLVLEYISMDLRTYIRMIPEGELIPRVEQKFILYQILQGTYYCHQRMIMHRDLKPANILIDKSTLAIKIADFGLARRFEMMTDRKYSPTVVTLWYRAPEVIARLEDIKRPTSFYTIAIDLWSIGCIFAELARKIPLFNGKSAEELATQMCTILSPPDENVLDGPKKHLFFRPKVPRSEDAKLERILDSFMDPNGIEILKRMLDYNPATRASAKQLLKDPYFSDIDRTKLPAGDFDGTLQLPPR